MYHLISYFEIWDAVGLDDITDYSKPVPIMGMPVGYDTVSFEDIKKIIENLYQIKLMVPYLMVLLYVVAILIHLH